MKVGRCLGGGLAVAALAAAPLVGLAGTALADTPAAGPVAVQDYQAANNRGWSQTEFGGKHSDDMADDPWRVNKDWSWVKDWCVNHTKESKLQDQQAKQQVEQQGQQDATSYAGVSCPKVWPNDVP
ncbi:hypothetical protein [Pseudonocardia sp. ICBG601]|uniref:hypothetical protein n=1 Tax=Pseudonocardia sp. ICBG601 TaxID=2846759 RepID=UPI001CF6ABE7|nr:hypothetical protein [Pseudonocardia sp. ICBG601]